MPFTYALLVGIDAYRVVPPLRGCRKDVERAAEFLRSRAGNDLSVVDLYDRQATKAAVVGAFRRHLGRAGPGDTALFWFSGHGSTAPVPAELWYLEPLNEMQTMLCADSREGEVTDLLDKELAVLIQGVADQGAHVAVVLDCCHAGGATRATDPDVDDPGFRGVKPLPAPPPIGSLLPELRIRDGSAVPAHLSPAGRQDHVALAACHPFQRAWEIPMMGEVRGLFSWALLDALRRLGPAATYRELLTAARCGVEDLRDQQVPELYPVDGDLADQPFLGGQLRLPVAPIVMRYVRGGWEINAGACHGLTPGEDGNETRVAVPGTSPVREARAVRVLTEHSTVAPIGWQPDQRQQYPVVLSGVPLAPTTVSVDHVPAVGQAIKAAAPGGRPSPHVRLGEPAELLVAAPRPGVFQICGPDGVSLAPEVFDPDRVVADLEHIARWRQVKALANPVSRLAGAVGIEVVSPLPGERTAPLDRPPLATVGDGTLHLEYRHEPSGWTAPTAFIRLRNHTDRRLFCVLLDLTDRFRLHAGLLPGAFVGPRQCAAALAGALVEFALPPDEPVRPGASVRDWLLLLVAETEFSAEPFDLPGLGRPLAGPTRTRGLTGVLDRLGLLAVHRDVGGPAASAYDWTTRILPVVTTVPKPG